MKKLCPVAVEFIVGDHDVGAVAYGFGLQPAFAFCRRDPQERDPTYSYIGLEVERLESTIDRERVDPFALLDACLRQFALQRRADLPPFQGGILAFLSHEAAEPSQAALSSPRFLLLFTREFVAIDHREGKAYLIRVVEDGEDEGAVAAILREKITTFRFRHGSLSGGVPSVSEVAADWSFDTTRAEHAIRVRSIHEALGKSDLEQAVLSIGMKKPFRGDAWAVFEQLYIRNPSPQAYYLNVDGFALAGATPLNFLTLQDRALLVETDAGTRPLGTTPAETEALAKDLMTTQKDIDEQRLIVDATISDLRVIAKEGRVEILVPLELRKFSHVMHLFTIFSAALADGVSPGAAARQCFPSPATCGFPRDKAMRLYRELEQTPRGAYGGVIGLFDYAGNIDSAVVIRSVWFSNGMAYSRNGGGIVASSDPASEYEECLAKARVVWECVAAAEVVPARPGRE